MTPPRGLSKRGNDLWMTLESQFDLSGAQGVLAHEACRAADRLEKLDRVISGDEETWMRIRDARYEGDDTVLVVNSAIAESRAQQLTLKQLLAAIGVPNAPSATKQTGSDNPLDELSQRRTSGIAGSPNLPRAKVRGK